MNKLLYQRKAYALRMRLYGTFNVIEGWIKQLEDPNCDWSADKLMFIHFDREAADINAMVSDQNVVDALIRCYPGEASELLEAAEDLKAVLPVLHNVRMELLRPHIRPDGKDINQEHFSVPGVKNCVENRALLNGLTVEQQKALEANLCPRGFTRLSRAEKQRLLDVFTEVLTDTR